MNRDLLQFDPPLQALVSRDTLGLGDGLLASDWMSFGDPLTGPVWADVLAAEFHDAFLTYLVVASPMWGLTRVYPSHVRRIRPQHKEPT